MSVVNIPGATGSTYTLVTADLDQQISVKVTATNSAGSANATSALTAPVVASGWSRVPLGPGGFISGLSFHPDGTRICRMDTSGAYRWNGTSSRWEMMVTKNSVDGFVGSIPDADSGPGQGTNPGTYEVAIAPSDSNRFYMMWAHNFDGRVWVSDNKGASWTKRTSRATDAFNANSKNWRICGKKLAVDPINKDHVICGGSVGVTISINAGVSWTTISTSQIPASTVMDDSTVEPTYLFAFDPNPVGPVSSGRTQTIYCFSLGIGVYKTINGGTTWALAAASGPTAQAYFMDVSIAGTVFIATGSSANMNIWRLPSGGSWSNPTTDVLGATANAHAVWSIASDPTNATKVIALSEIGTLSYSTDSGATWTGFGTHHVDFGPITWLNTLNNSAGYFGNYAMYGGCLTFDQTDGTVHFGHGLGTCKATPAWVKGLTNWTDNSIGLEQLCAKRLLKPPGNPNVIMAAMDQGMFACDGVHYPSTKGTTDMFAAAWDADFCWTDPGTIVGLLNQSPAPLPYEISGLTRNGGGSWARFSSSSYNPGVRSGGMLACGSDRDNFILTLGDDGGANGIYYTLNGGASWALSNVSGTGIPLSGDVGWLDNAFWARHTICSDKVTPNVFYGKNYKVGFVKSVDKGQTWTFVAALANGYGNARLQAVPGNAGHLFDACGLNAPGNFYDPLARSVNGAATWTRAHALVQEVHAIGFGKAKPSGGGYPAIYIIGYYNNVYGIYRSDDSCATWVMIGDYPLGCFDSAVDITGDPDVYGTCYVSLGASGIFKFIP